MSIRNRNEDYTHQYKSISVANGIYCGYNPVLTVNVPSDLIELKNLYCRIVMLSDDDVPTNKRKLYWIGGDPKVSYNPITDGLLVDAVQPNMMYLNALANGSGYIDVSVDLTHIIDKLTFSTGNTMVAGSASQPNFELNLIVDTENYVGMTGRHNGTMVLWKTDMIYTTRGIQ